MNKIIFHPTSKDTNINRYTRARCCNARACTDTCAWCQCRISSSRFLNSSTPPQQPQQPDRINCITQLIGLHSYFSFSFSPTLFLSLGHLSHHRPQARVVATLGTTTTRDFAGNHDTSMEWIQQPRTRFLAPFVSMAQQGPKRASNSLASCARYVVRLYLQSHH